MYFLAPGGGPRLNPYLASMLQRQQMLQQQAAAAGFNTSEMTGWNASMYQQQTGAYQQQLAQQQAAQQAAQPQLTDIQRIARAIYHAVSQMKKHT